MEVIDPDVIGEIDFPACYLRNLKGSIPKI
jgi:hypothetical protein